MDQQKLIQQKTKNDKSSANYGQSQGLPANSLLKKVNWLEQKYGMRSPGEGSHGVKRKVGSHAVKPRHQSTVFDSNLQRYGDQFSNRKLFNALSKRESLDNFVNVDSRRSSQGLFTNQKLANSQRLKLGVGFPNHHVDFDGEIPSSIRSMNISEFYPERDVKARREVARDKKIREKIERMNRIHIDGQHQMRSRVADLVIGKGAKGGIVEKAAATAVDHEPLPLRIADFKSMLSGRCSRDCKEKQEIVETQRESNQGSPSINKNYKSSRIYAQMPNRHANPNKVSPSKISQQPGSKEAQALTAKQRYQLLKDTLALFQAVGRGSNRRISADDPYPAVGRSDHGAERGGTVLRYDPDDPADLRLVQQMLYKLEDQVARIKKEKEFFDEESQSQPAEDGAPQQSRVRTVDGIKWDDIDLDGLIQELRNEREAIAERLKQEPLKPAKRVQYQLPRISQPELRARSQLHEDFNFVNRKAQSRMGTSRFGFQTNAQSSRRSSGSVRYTDRLHDVYMKNGEDSFRRKLDDAEHGIQELIWKYNGLHPDEIKQIDMELGSGAPDGDNGGDPKVDSAPETVQKSSQPNRSTTQHHSEQAQNRQDQLNVKFTQFDGARNQKSNENAAETAKKQYIQDIVDQSMRKEVQRFDKSIDHYNRSRSRRSMEKLSAANTHQLGSSEAPRQSLKGSAGGGPPSLLPASSSPPTKRSPSQSPSNTRAPQLQSDQGFSKGLKKPSANWQEYLNKKVHIIPERAQRGTNNQTALAGSQGRQAKQVSGLPKSDREGSTGDLEHGVNGFPTSNEFQLSRIRQMGSERNQNYSQIQDAQKLALPSQQNVSAEESSWPSKQRTSSSRDVTVPGPQADDAQDLKKMLEEANTHEQKMRELQILGIMNKKSTKGPSASRAKLDITKIREIRRNALNLSHGEFNTPADREGSKMMLQDLRALSVKQQTSHLSPAQTQTGFATRRATEKKEKEKAYGSEMNRLIGRLGSSAVAVDPAPSLVCPASPIQKKLLVQQALEKTVNTRQQERRLSKLVNMLRGSKVKDPLQAYRESSYQKAKEEDPLFSTAKTNKSRRLDFKSLEKGDKTDEVLQDSEASLERYDDGWYERQDENKQMKSTGLEKQMTSAGLDILQKSSVKRYDHANVLDPGISAEERQRRYERFRSYHIRRLDQLIRKRKKQHRIDNPDDYKSDDSLQSLFAPDEPRRMFGRLPKNKKTGASYKIPNLEQIIQILTDNMKSTEQVVDALIPGDISLKDQLCALAIMQENKLVTREMLEAIKEREDKLSQYINFITGTKIFLKDGRGALSSDRMFTNALTRHLSKGFQDYVGFCDNSSQRVATALLSKLKYFQKCKNSANPKARAELEKDPYFNFFCRCQAENELALPILEKIHNKTLSLLDYSLSPVHAQALRLASKFFDGIVNRILLDNCGVTDEQFAQILTSLGELQDFKSIIYRKNEFGLQSAAAVHELTVKRVPNQLEELRICNCRLVSRPIMEEGDNNEERTLESLLAEKKYKPKDNVPKLSVLDVLLTNLIERSYLTKLSLVGASMTDKTLPLLCEFISSSRYIESIDISWSNRSPQDFDRVLELLRDNRKLKFVNLSWNQLVHSKKLTHWDVAKDPKILIPKPQKPKLTEEELNELEPEERAKILREEEKQGVSESELFVADCLSRFIKYNPFLLHLDLQGTGLTEYVLKEIARALRKSRSIVGIHLSENNGLTPEIKDYLFNRIHCKTSDFSQLRIINLQDYEHMIKQTNYKVNHQMFQDSIRLREIMERKRQEIPKQIVGVQRADRTCVITRWNGHKGEMPGKPGQWQMLQTEHENCWICDKWTYSLVFFSPAKIQRANHWDQCQDLKEHVQRQLRLFHQETGCHETIDHSDDLIEIDSNNINIDPAEIVHLYGDCTNWDPKRMIPFLQYVEIIDKDKPNFFKDLQDAKQIRAEAQTVDDLTKEEYTVYMKFLNQYRKEIRKDRWERILQKNLKYKKPAIVNLDPKELARPERLYVLPIFIKSGKQNMLVKYRDTELQESHDSSDCGRCESLDSPEEWTFIRGIVEYRTEDIICFTKQMKSHVREYTFDREKSVFKKWQEDTPTILRRCIDYDFNHWKIERMKLPFEERSKCERIIEDYFPLLKHVMIFMQSWSDCYPGIQMTEFSRFAKQWGLIDSYTPSSRIDGLYLASILAQDVKKASQLMSRWGFLEFVIRISKDKYLDRKLASTISEAVERFINDYFVEQWKKLDIVGWQDLRSDFIWAEAVDDLLRVNLPGLELVYEKFKKPNKKLLGMEECLKIFAVHSAVDISEPQAKFAYGMSKQTVIDESKNSDTRGYMVMEMAEFLEMICRVAIAKFKASDLEALPLNQKVEFILDDLLPLVGMERKIVTSQFEEVSESDEDY